MDECGERVLLPMAQVNTSHRALREVKGRVTDSKGVKPFTIHAPSREVFVVNNPCVPKLGLNDIQVACLIGHGVSSEVVLAVDKTALRRRKTHGDPVQLQDVMALKIVPKSKQEAYLAELNILKLLAANQHPFLARLATSAETNTKLWLGIEFYPGGDLHTLMPTLHYLPEARAKIYIAEIALGLAHLHKLNIVFRDLKPENVAIGADGHVRIIDFGLAVILDESHYNSESGRREIVTHSGTLAYCAPEVLRRDPHGFEIDWWSLGALMYEMMLRTLPFDDEDPDILVHKICREKLMLNLEHSKGSISYDAFNLMGSLLTKCPVRRLGYWASEDVLEHEFFSSLCLRSLTDGKIRPPVIPILEDALDVSNFHHEITNTEPRLFGSSPTTVSMPCA